MKDIRIRKEDCYRRIKEANDELDKIRLECKHPETERCNYMWAPGHIDENALICSICGERLMTEASKYIISIND